MKCINQVLIAVLIIFFSTALPAISSTSETASIVQSERPAIEVMFVLDTTGSMGGMIAAAKEKIWSIANTLASADPAPDIKMGLVGYRDRGDQYVTMVTKLSDDLDAVYASLIQFQANGGGDGPESVNQALHEAVTKTGWSHDAAIYRVIFLVGDAPPHMDYQDDVKYVRTCRAASETNIIINTIQCGNMGDTTPVWQEIARLAEGEYFKVAQSGSAVLYDTPYDKEIAGLSRELDQTRIFYGSASYMEEMEEKKDTSEKLYEAAAPSAVAKRAIFNSSKSGNKNFLGAQELIHDLENNAIKISEIKTDELPAELQEMEQDDLEIHVRNQGKKRKQLQSELENLAQKRQAFIENQLKNESGLKENSLDGKIYKCIQTQATDKNIEYKDGPLY